jgi:voltage-gated potassium channel
MRDMKIFSADYKYFTTYQRQTIKQRIWCWLDGDSEDGGWDKAFHHFILTLIVLNVFAIVIESIPAVKANPSWHLMLNQFERMSLWIFAVEYSLRLWSSKTVMPRRRFVFSTMGIVDLATLFPLILPFFGVDIRLFPLLRAVRMFRVMKLFRYIPGIELITAVLHAKKSELLGSVFVILLMLTIGGTAMYFIENGAQPDKFSSIPDAMWWAVATMTTTGYGDIYPITLAGKVIGGIFSILGIFSFALPTAIIGSGFIDEINERKKHYATAHN